MEKKSLPATPFRKLYDTKEIIVGTFLGGPLAAGYLLAENYKHFDENKKAKKTWIIAILSAVILYSIVLFVPQIEYIPVIVIPLVYTAITRVILKLFQEKRIERSIANNVPIYSMWRAILVGLIGILLPFVFLNLVFLFVD
jgi:L-cystine uptake protein TcyP (sodium:dicarboxylate symporter family)